MSLAYQVPCVDPLHERVRMWRCLALPRLALHMTSGCLTRPFFTAAPIAVSKKRLALAGFTPAILTFVMSYQIVN